MRAIRSFALGALVVVLAGCGGAAPKQAAEGPPKEKQKAVFSMTAEFVKYDPNDKTMRVASNDVKYSNPVTGGLEAVPGILGQMSSHFGKHELDLYQAEHGKYPNYQEFMAKVVNGPGGTFKLPVMPGLRKYAYDEAKHEIVVLEPVAGGK